MANDDTRASTGNEETRDRYRPVRTVEAVEFACARRQQAGEQVPIAVYLDSNDISLLSDERRCGVDERAILDKLLRWIQDGDVHCYFTSLHLSEATPLTADSDNAGRRRAELIKSLCGDNVGVFWHDLISAELRADGVNVPSPLRRDGRWYPNVEDVIPDHEQFKAMLRAEIASLPRAQRREQTNATFAANGSLRDSFVRQLLLNAPVPAMTAAQVAATLQYLAGKASRASAISALHEVLSNPVTCMDWATRDARTRGQFAGLVRDPSAKLATLLSEQMRNMMDLSAKSEAHASARTAFLSRHWAEYQRATLLKVARRFAIEIGAAVPLDASEVETRCKGLSTAINAMVSAWRGTFTATPREPLPSDFVDGLHALYAPYVDLFRADAFMAPHVLRYCVSHGTRVVSKLRDLPSAIDDLLSDRRQ